VGACPDAKTSAASRSAFRTLHRLFPNSEWAEHPLLVLSGERHGQNLQGAKFV
jgi:hypothetical protein